MGQAVPGRIAKASCNAQTIGIEVVPPLGGATREWSAECWRNLASLIPDITDRHDLQQRMRQWSAAFEDIRDGVIITDALGRIQSVNHAFTQITGYPAEEAIGATMKLLFSTRSSGSPRAPRTSSRRRCRFGGAGITTAPGPAGAR